MRGSPFFSDSSNCPLTSSPSAKGIIEAAIGFGILIFVHELGHFLACKWIGVRVDVFSLGFGPSLKKKWGETEYRLGICPIGGYVKMAGEEPTPDKPPQPGEFYSKSVGRRSIVFVAGVVMNLIFGFVAFMLAYQIGVPVQPAIVGGVQPGSPAWNVGLKRGDIIEAIRGVSPPIDFEDLSATITLASPRRRSRPERRPRRPAGSTWSFIPNTTRPAACPPPASCRWTRSCSTKSRRRGSGKDQENADPDRLFQAGLKPGDTITAVQVAGAKEPTRVATPDEFELAVGDCAGKPVRVFYRRGAESAEESVIVEPELVGRSALAGHRLFLEPRHRRPPGLRGRKGRLEGRRRHRLDRRPADALARRSHRKPGKGG